MVRRVEHRGFLATLLFVPETEALSLEGLDQGEYLFSPTTTAARRAIFNSPTPVLSVPRTTHAAYEIKALPHNIKKYIFHIKVDPLPPLYGYEGEVGEKPTRRRLRSRVFTTHPFLFHFLSLI